MKRTLIAAIMATAAIAFSCAEREEPSDLNGDSLVSDPIATIEDFILDGTTTKTSLSIGDNKVLFAFNDDDVLRVYPGSSPYGTRFYVEENKGTSCIFKATGFKLVEGETYAAFYPGTSTDYLQNAIKVDFTGQVQGEIGAADFLYAAAIKPVNGACRFSMKHLGALMLMDVTFEKAGTFKELSLTSSNTPFFTAGTVDLTADPIAVTGTTTSNTITLALGGADGMSVAAGQTVTFYMMIAPVDMSSNTITMELKNGDDVISSEFVGKNYVPGKAYMVSADPGEPLGDPIDLSAEETANTYIVSEPGYYSFDATIAGNGKKVSWVAAFASYAYPEYSARTGLKKFTGDGVEVILNQNNCVSDVSFEDGRILFKATGAKGNAKLTLTNGGARVWTWVIWCTDEPSVHAITVDDVVTYHIMDRNLGATSSGSVLPNSIEDVAGLYYQYGNPLGYTWEEFENGVLAQMNGSATMKHALADFPNNPNLNCTVNERGLPNGGDYYWFFPDLDGVPDKTLYGKLWGAGSMVSEDLEFGDMTKKTLYDPCPAGYKVMGWDTFEGYDDVEYSNAFGVYVAVDDGDLFIPYNGFAWTIEYGYYWAGRGPYPCTIEGVGGPYASLWTSGHNGKNVSVANAWAARSADRGVRTSEGLADGTSHIVARGLGVRCILDEFGDEE
ncbi:MAG: fimbrillin family protein [Bacteroidales bacterium]|nr:fimbrillin family protein [Bacteroidales bacterium]